MASPWATKRKSVTAGSTGSAEAACRVCEVVAKIDLLAVKRSDRIVWLTVRVDPNT